MNVFLSFSSADHKTADRLRLALVRLGFEISSDDPTLEPGAGRRSRLEEAINSTDAIIVLVNPAGPDEAQQYTWQAALSAVWQDASKKLLPLLLQGASVPAFIYSSSCPFTAVHIDDPRNPSEIESAAQAIAEALAEKRAVRTVTNIRSGTSADLGPSRSRDERAGEQRYREDPPHPDQNPDTGAGTKSDRGDRLSEIKRYAETLKERG